MAEARSQLVRSQVHLDIPDAVVGFNRYQGIDLVDNTYSKRERTRVYIEARIVLERFH